MDGRTGSNHQLKWLLWLLCSLARAAMCVEISSGGQMNGNVRHPLTLPALANAVQCRSMPFNAVQCRSNQALNRDDIDMIDECIAITNYRINVFC